MRFIKGKTGKSIIIILVFLILFNVCVPNYSYADEGNDTSLTAEEIEYSCLICLFIFCGYLKRLHLTYETLYYRGG